MTYVVDFIQRNKVESDADTDSKAKAAARLFLSRYEKYMWRLTFAGLVSHLSASQRPDYCRCPSQKAHESYQRAFSTVSAEVTQFSISTVNLK